MFSASGSRNAPSRAAPRSPGACTVTSGSPAKCSASAACRARPRAARRAAGRGRACRGRTHRPRARTAAGARAGRAAASRRRACGERQAVRAERAVGAALVRLDHLRTATGVAGDRVDGERRVGGEEPALAQRPHECQEAGRIAAGICDAQGTRRARHARLRVSSANTRTATRCDARCWHRARAWCFLDRARPSPRAASSGRHRITRSASLTIARFAAGSFARSRGRLTSSTSSRAARRCRIEPGRPVLAIDEDRRSRHRAALY